MIRRILPLTLTTALCLTLVPTSALAANADPDAISHAEIHQTVTDYLTFRQTEDDSPDWSVLAELTVPGVVADEQLRAQLLEQEGIQLLDSDWTLLRADSDDLQALCYVEETLTCLVDGTEQTATVTHELTLMQELDGSVVVGGDGYDEGGLTGFTSCSYLEHSGEEGISLLAVSDYTNTHVNTGNMIADVIAIAATQVGYEESSSGYTKYGDWYGLPNSHWCAMFVSWCADQAGIPQNIWKTFAKCSVGLDWFDNLGQYHTAGSGYTPVPGDLVFFGTSRSNVTHVGLVESFDGTTLLTLEGNHSDKVCEVDRTHSSTTILGYAHPAYTGSNIVTPDNNINEPVVTPPADGTFSDVSSSDWFYEDVMYASENGLFSGTSSTTFSPHMTMTRAMMVQVLYNLSGTPAVSGTGAFSDVNSTSWYAKSVQWAYASGIVSGYEDGTFRPEISVTREQMAQILYNYYTNYLGHAVNEYAGLGRFADTAQVSPWAVAAFQWAVCVNLISGSADGGALYLNPVNGATRAQTAAVLSRFMKNQLI